MISFKNGLLIVLMVFGIPYAQGAEGGSFKRSTDDEESSDQKKSSSAFDERYLRNCIESCSFETVQSYIERFPEESRKEPLVNYAALRGNVEILKFLVDQKGFSLTEGKQGKKGKLPFFFSKNIETIDFFLDRGVDINIQNEQGGTILFYLALDLPDDLIEYLVSRGLDPSIKDILGRTARDYRLKIHTGYLTKYRDFEIKDLEEEMSRFDTKINEGLAKRLKKKE